MVTDTGSSLGDERIAELNAHVVAGSAHSNWIFLELVTESGATGWGEATVDGADEHVLTAFDGIRPDLIGQSLQTFRRRTRGPAVYPAPLPANAILGALDQAEWDVRGTVTGAPVWQLLGGTGAPLPYYANLNRGIGPDRSPERFAACASLAVADGASGVKIAPFDAVARTDWEERETRDLVRIGLERVAAVRAAVSSTTDLLVDCHWRFSGRTAVQVLRALEEFDPYWVEAPVSELDQAEWRWVRDRTDLRLAGGEMLRTPRDFRLFIESSGADVVMPDVKYCGGITGLLDIAAVASSFSIQVAPHNPSGPVASIASAHASSAMPNFLTLEWPWGESGIREHLVGGAERFDGPRMLLPTTPGLGLAVNRDVVRDHPPTRAVRTVSDWVFGPDRPPNQPSAPGGMA